LKIYLIVTGIIFSLLTLFHVWRIIAEWSGFNAYFCIIGLTTAATAALAIWAWKLLLKLRR